MFLVSAVVLAFLWTATEWTACELGFQAQLGPPWFERLGWPAYQPPAFLWWWFAYDAYAHEIFVEGCFIAGAGGVSAFVRVDDVGVAGARGKADHHLRLRPLGREEGNPSRRIAQTGLGSSRALAR